ncbi:hypothetical protein H5410_056835 [Solanum commersonii]|uniref:Uncharacterized protein n=1 Tax=Solanum commersonii TaxID=4109 RepID=A0A9J5WMX1_SOLCO|nr:hypothetical protein H5410_056835 [Solanum commersonii]
MRSMAPQEATIAIAKTEVTTTDAAQAFAEVAMKHPEDVSSNIKDVRPYILCLAGVSSMFLIAIAPVEYCDFSIDGD